MSVQLDNMNESIKYWTPLVSDPCQLWALLGSEDGEDSFLTHAVGDHGEAVGAGQWHGLRRGIIKTNTGIDVGTASHLDQLKAMHWEMTDPKSAYRHVWSEIMATTTIPDAVTVLVVKYEQSGSQARDIARRTMLAQQLQAQFGSAA